MRRMTEAEYERVKAVRVGKLIHFGAIGGSAAVIALMILAADFGDKPHVFSGIQARLKEFKRIVTGEDLGR
eukprot:tig00020557_g11126.t1